MTLNDNIARFNSGLCSDAYKFLGCHALGDKTRFTLWAPNAKAVSVVGDFNDWDDSALPMARLPGGFWTAETGALANGVIYKYAVTGKGGGVFLKADPFAFHAETGPATGSKVWALDGFRWTDGEYMAALPEKDVFSGPMSIYEVHPGSWRLPEGGGYPWYRTMGDQLAEYCAGMGYTHVELLPVTEYPYEGSWGYQTTGFFAPTSRYGTPQDFMYFVDRLHSAGIGVILDWTPAHFPRDAHGLAMLDGTALFERADPKMASHPHWGTLIFDYGKPQVQSFLISSAAMFLDTYHIDGLRCDAVTSMLYLDYGRGNDYTRNKNGGNICLEAVELLQRLNSAIRGRFPGRFTVAEESTAFPKVTGGINDGSLGFHFKWDMGFMHDMLDYMALDPLYRKGSHNKLTFSMMYAFSERFILAFSHDEVVHGKRSMLEKMFGDQAEKFASLRALLGYQYAHPGKKLNFMGTEFGQFIEWDYKKQLDWFLLEYPDHAGLQSYVRELNRLYCESAPLFQVDSSWDGFSWLNVDDADRSSISFLRRDKAGRAMVCAFNFTPVRYDRFVIGLPQPGILREKLNSDDIRFSGAGVLNKPAIRWSDTPFLDHPYSAEITLPPLSAVFFELAEPKPPYRVKPIKVRRKKA